MGRTASTWRRSTTTCPIVAISSHEVGNAALRRAGAQETCAKAQMHLVAEVVERLSAQYLTPEVPYSRRRATTPA